MFSASLRSLLEIVQPIATILVFPFHIDLMDSFEDGLKFNTFRVLFNDRPADNKRDKIRAGLAYHCLEDGFVVHTKKTRKKYSKHND